MSRLPIFRKKNNKTGSEKLSGTPDPQPKYLKPKIMLIDLPSDVLSAIKEKEYNVISGSFGHPYKLRDDRVLTDANLPNYTEQEIIVVDLSSDVKTAEGEITSDYKDTGLRAESRGGIIDPRPLAMLWHRRHSERIIQHGGIFVIFAEPRENWTYYDSGSKFTADNLSFLPCLHESRIEVKHDNGHEVQIEDSEKNIAKAVLAKHIKEFKFSCILERNYNTDEENWVTLASNKFGQIVSAAILIDSGNENRPSWALIFPHMKDKAGFLLELIENVLPDIAPYLFPFSEKTSWFYERTYELPQVKSLRNEIEHIKESCEKQVDHITEQIEKYRKENKFLYDLLSETDKALVKAVICALRVLGLEQVIDVDEEVKTTRESGGLREDIQIKDDSPILIVDVKGIANLPSDPDVMQSLKHASIRMREWDCTDVKPLTIINHQRHLPSLDRDNKQPFRAEIVTAASQNDLGLMTTWDLHRLVRSFLRNNWRPENVKPLFYKSQRISVIPTNYEYVGKVEKIWKEPEAFSVIVEESNLESRDKIGIETPIEILEYEIASLMLNDQKVVKTEIGNEIGVKTNQFPSNIKKGFRIYKIKGEIRE